MAKNQFLNWGKSLKLPEMQFHGKIDLFDFTSFSLDFFKFSGPLWPHQSNVDSRQRTTSNAQCNPTPSALSLPRPFQLVVLRKFAQNRTQFSNVRQPSYIKNKRGLLLRNVLATMVRSFFFETLRY